MIEEPQIIYEANDFLVVNKPAHWLVHQVTAKKGGKIITDWLLERYPEIGKVGDKPVERPGIVHRLDQETSGVLIVARNQPTFEYLKKMFANGFVRKNYLALVNGRLIGKGEINKPIGLIAGTTRRSILGKKMKMIKPAVTEYEVIKVFQYSVDEEVYYFTLLTVTPKTGRTHQIRVHLASIGHSVCGDKLYGPKKSVLEIPRQFLHAASVEFTLKEGERVKIDADLPDDLKEVLKRLLEAKI
ncbi:MAG: RluA family pseudouridine synthase [Patescibacteria group bacterium]